jgi:Flp pilus assembly protein TadG
MSARRFKLRRGAVAALVGIVMVALLMLMAAALDVSRFYVQKNELQTGADAAALAGVITLLRDSTQVVAQATAFDVANRVQQKSIPSASVSVQCGTWVDSTSTYSASGQCGALENAVKVVATDSARYLIPGIIRASKTTVSATSYAWLAYVGSSGCIKPFGIPWSTLTKILDPSNPDTLRDLTTFDLQQLRSLPNAQRAFFLRTGSPSTPGNFGAINLPPAGNYGNDISTCNPTVLGPGDTVNIATGARKQPTIDGASGLCSPLSPQPSQATPMGICYAPDGTIGTPIKSVFWASAVVCSGASCTAVIKALGSFKLDSVSKDATIYGTFVAEGSGGILANKTSTIRRPILVK